MEHEVERRNDGITVWVIENGKRTCGWACGHGPKAEALAKRLAACIDASRSVPSIIGRRMNADLARLGF